MDSILNSVKQSLGISEDVEHFDSDLIMHINSVFAILTQMNVGPDFGYIVTGEFDTWTDFYGNRKDLEFIKTYVYMKVRVIFDPPTSSVIMDALNNRITELEWRIYSAVDNMLQ